MYLRKAMPVLLLRCKLGSVQHAACLSSIQAGTSRVSRVYVPPTSSNTPDAGVTQALHCLIAITLVSAPANVAATSRGTTYLHHHIASEDMNRCSHTSKCLVTAATDLVSDFVGMLVHMIAEKAGHDVTCRSGAPARIGEQQACALHKLALGGHIGQQCCQHWCAARRGCQGKGEASQISLQNTWFATLFVLLHGAGTRFVNDFEAVLAQQPDSGCTAGCHAASLLPSPAALS